MKEQWINQGRVRRARREDNAPIAPHICPPGDVIVDQFTHLEQAGEQKSGHREEESGLVFKASTTPHICQPGERNITKRRHQGR